MDFSKKYSFNNSYSVYGAGKKAYFTFHGFGQSPEVYKKLASIFPDSIIYSFQLFGHESGLEATATISRLNWISEFKALVHSLNINQVHLVAHSMGARHVGAIIENMPNKVGKVYLIAPNGFENFNLFDFCTRTGVGEFLFNNFLKHYDKIKPLLDLAKSFPFTRELLLFATSQINHENKRKILRNTWNAYGKFGMNQTLIKKNIVDFNLDIELILAKKDQIINNKNLLKLFKNIKNVQIQQLETSHYHVLAEWMKQLLIKK